ncbi:MAG: AraC family transcriptional regulator [Ferruginibacter sp.]
MKVHIKNMVCPRCVMAVKTLLGNLDIKYKTVELGEVMLEDALSQNSLLAFRNGLSELGFELLDDQKTQMIEKVKGYLTDLVQKADIDEHFTLSDHIPKLILKDYSTISKLFSQVESVTLEQFFILQKIEKTKELITYDELSISEIAFKLGYSNIAHLSNQFKKITGFTPTQFKQLNQKRKSIV